MLLRVQSVNGLGRVFYLYVRINLRSLLLNVIAVGTVEARRLTALVFHVTMKRTIIIVYLAAIGACVNPGPFASCSAVNAPPLHGYQPADAILPRVFVDIWKHKIRHFL